MQPGAVRLRQPGIHHLAANARVQAHHLGVPLILAARDHLPRVRLRVAEAMSGYVLDWLRPGRVDLGLLYSVVEDRGLRSVSLLSEELVLCGQAQGDDGGGAVTLDALADRKLVPPSPGHRLRDLLDATASGAGLSLSKEVEIDAYGSITAMVERGLGFSVLPAHAVRREVEERRLCAWPFDPPLRRTVHLVLPTDRPLSHAAQVVEALCRATLAEPVRSGAWHAAQMSVSAPPSI